MVKMNPFVIIKDVYDASEAGQQLANPTIWAKRATLTQQLTLLLAAVVGLANQFLGTEIQLSEEDLRYVVTGIAVVGGLVANQLHISSNPHAGRIK
jgi:type III secretory pathway component EscS